MKLNNTYIDFTNNIPNNFKIFFSIMYPTRLDGIFGKSLCFTSKNMTQSYMKSYKHKYLNRTYPNELYFKNHE